MKLASVRWFVAFALVALVATPYAVSARPSPTPTPAPTPTPVADPAVAKLATQQFVAWQAGSVDRALYAPELQPKLTDAKITDVSKLLGALGPLTESVYVAPFDAADLPAGARGYIFQMRCTGGSVYQWMVIDRNGKIATLFFKDKLDIETIEQPGTPPPSPRA